MSCNYLIRQYNLAIEKLSKIIKSETLLNCQQPTANRLTDIADDQKSDSNQLNPSDNQNSRRLPISTAIQHYQQLYIDYTEVIM